MTNEHVVKGASQISVTIGGNKYPATVVATDTQNDLAIIKTDKNDIKPPYSIREERCDIGERCYVLGYPLTQQLGNEIRLTDGLISARSGYQGNANQYQISAPVQPGNSGCPLFDENGRIIGIVNSGIPSADNVGFAIKTSSLLNLLDSCSLDSFIPTHGNSRFRDHVEEITQYVYLIECNNR